MVHRLGLALLDLVVPQGCAGCGERTGGQVLCERCGPALLLTPRVVSPSPAPPGLPTVVAVGGYEGVLREVILAHKDGGRLSLARPLGLAVARAVAVGLGGEAGRPSAVTLVPIPSRRRTTRRRGHDPVLRMTSVACAALRSAGFVARVAPVLHLNRTVADQAGLTARDRQVNVSGALGVRPGSGGSLARRPVLLVDDVLTTGSTLAEAARAMRFTRAQVVGAVVIAATRRRSAAGLLDAASPLD